MKKVLIASTALVAAGLMTAGTASASEKIKLNLGGFSKWWVVATDQENNSADYNTVDIKGDNEIYFSGSTTLDNGMKVGIQVELEAGGNTETTGGDTIDESYVFVETGFGKFIVGSENNGTYLLHVTAPDAAGNWNEGGIMTGGNVFAKSSSSSLAGTTGTGVSTITPLSNSGNTTAIVTDNDAEKITYVAPTFYGLTAGASYVPNSGEDDRGATNLQGATVGEIYGAGALYANTFGGVGVKVSAGWVTYDVEGGIKADDTGVNEYAFGTQLSYAGFTVGGSYRKVNGEETVETFDGYAWDAGVQYASGPYAVSLSYFRSSVEGNPGVDANDKIEFYQLSGKYTLGAGVDLLASVGHANFDEESNADANENDGWTVMTGLSLAF